MTEFPVDPSNVEAARAWNGDDGAHWARWAKRYDDSVAYHHAALMKAAAISHSERILDVGCGSGQTTRDAARLAAGGHALGVDLSHDLVAYARRAAADDAVHNVTFEQADAQVHPFDPASFEVAISRTGAMFFGDPVRAFTNIARSLVPGGRLTLLVWQAMARNEWVWEFTRVLSPGGEVQGPPPDAPGPFSLADPPRTRSILTAADFSDVTIDPCEGPMCFGSDADDAFAFLRDMGFTKWRLSLLAEPDRPRALDDLRSSLVAHDTGNGVIYASAAWLVTATKR